MTTATKRSRLIAVLLAIFLTPFVSMLYLGRGWRAITYLALTFLVLAIAISLAASGYLPSGLDYSILNLPLALIGAIDSYRIARQHREAFSGPWYSKWYGTIGAVAGLALIVLTIRGFLYEPFRIPSSAMLPTLALGDFIVVNKYIYGVRLPFVHRKVIDVSRPKHGDVVVFYYPRDPSLQYIKRVVGLPGDTVSYHDKQLTINGQKAPQQANGTYSYVVERLAFISTQRYTENLIGVSYDIAIMPEVPTVRRAGVREFPNKQLCSYDNTGFTCKVPPGHYFAMGDNRDNTEDSRYWGFVPEENLIGKAVGIWWNSETPKRAATMIE